MIIPPNAAKRFADLIKEGKSFPIEISHGTRHIQTGPWKLWAASALNLTSHVLGQHSVHYQELQKTVNSFQGYVSNAEAAVAVFEAAWRDIEAGVVGSLEKRAAGEVFADFVTAARTALSEGQKDVAAVLACAALEDTLKKFAALNDVDVKGKTMDGVIGALKAAGLVSGAQKGLLEAMPKIRNAAMHADWQKLSEPDVASVIAFTQQFLLLHLS